MIERGLTCIHVLDVSHAAIERAHSRLGTSATIVTWIEADVRSHWQVQSVDVWHDRATFHFLIDASDRQKYLAALRRALKPSGHVVIATFAPDGPAMCSGLPTVRYSPESLAMELGPDFLLVDSTREAHVTPGGALQPFTFAVFRRMMDHR